MTDQRNIFELSSRNADRGSGARYA